MGQKLIKFHGKNIFPHKINLLILSHLGFNFELNFISTPHRIRTFQIGVRSEFLESKENHEKHRREKNHFNEAAFDPKYKKGPHEWKEKGNKLHWGSEAYDALAPEPKMLDWPSKDVMLAYKDDKMPAARSRCE